jgi:hypothetical protein
MIELLSWRTLGRTMQKSTDAIVYETVAENPTASRSGRQVAACAHERGSTGLASELGDRKNCSSWESLGSEGRKGNEI